MDITHKYDNYLNSRDAGQQDAYAISRWLAESDDRRVADLEGWILGCVKGYTKTDMNDWIKSRNHLLIYSFSHDFEFL